MKNQLVRNYEVSELCLLAGQIMLESGAETYRVEDTMVRIAVSYGVHHAESYVTPTVIILSIEGDYPTKTKIRRIDNRSTDLNKIALVNNLSREISEGKWTPNEAYEYLFDLRKQKLIYSTWFRILASAIVSAFCVILFLGTWQDVLPGFFIGGLGYLCFYLINEKTNVKMFAELIASLLIGIGAIITVEVGLGFEIDKIVIGSVMPLVPGLLITNAIRDLMAGHLVSGLAKGAEAVLTAFAIGAGIAVSLVFFE